MPTAASKYAVFISYSHQDKAVARWFHRQLDGYMLVQTELTTSGI